MLKHLKCIGIGLAWLLIAIALLGAAVLIAILIGVGIDYLFAVWGLR